LRIGAALRAALLFGLAFRLHHHFRGAPIDYGALAAASAASWAGLPGPGEPVLIAAGVFAAQHRLDLASVLVTAWASAAAGGVAGWLLGMKAGRVVLTAPGPLRRARLKAIERGDAVFRRVPVIAILFTPAWIAGIHRVRPRLYLAVNVISAAAWALGIGLGAYFAGPPVIEVVNDLGWLPVVGLVLLVLTGVALELLRRRRKRRRAPERGDPQVL
jgi:membrane protein DedA with SNARE-associated domain